MLFKPLRGFNYISFLWPILLSLIIGSIFVYPDIRFIKELGPDFKGITLTGNVDEVYYLARLNGVYKGDYRLANVGIYEHQNAPWTIPPFLEVIIAKIGKMVGLSVTQLDICLSFFLPILLFWLIYFLIFKLTDSKKIGIIGGGSVILGYDLFTSNLSLLKAVFLEFNCPRPLWFLRPVSPQLNYVPFLLSMLLIYISLTSKRKLVLKLILTSVCMGSLTYVSPYYFSFVLSGLAVWLLASLIQKRFFVFKKIITICVLSLVISIPFWLHSLVIFSHPAFSYLSEKFAVMATRRPIFPIFYIFISILVIFLNRNAKYSRFWFLTSFLIGGFLCLNQQILTGKIMEPVHWRSYTNRTFIIIAFAVSLQPLYLYLVRSILSIDSKKLKYFKNLAFGFCICFLIFISLLQQNNYYKQNKPFYLQPQSLSAPFNWFNNNTQKDDVILIDPFDQINGEMPSISPGHILAYTHNFVYTGMLSDSLLTKEETEYRYLSALSFFRHPLNEAYQFFSYNNGVFFRGMEALIAYGGTQISQEYLFHLENKYKNFFKKDQLKLIKKFRVNYIFVKDSRSLKNYLFLKKVYDDGKYRIYKFSKTSRSR